MADSQYQTPDRSIGNGGERDSALPRVPGDSSATSPSSVEEDIYKDSLGETDGESSPSSQLRREGEDGFGRPTILQQRIMARLLDRTERLLREFRREWNEDDLDEAAARLHQVGVIRELRFD